MKSPSKAVKAGVLLLFIGLLTTYLLYASGVIRLGSKAMAPSVSVLASGIPSDSPPFKLPYFITKHYTDTLFVVGYKAFPDDGQKVLLLVMEKDAFIMEEIRASSSKSARRPINVAPSPGTDSVLVYRDWGHYPSYLLHMPRVHRDRFYSMSSKASVLDETVPTIHEKEVEEAHQRLAAVKWMPMNPGHFHRLPSAAEMKQGASGHQGTVPINVPVNSNR